MMLTRAQKHESYDPLNIAVSDGGHPDDVRYWRRDQFLAMGFADYVAAMLADTRIDLHQMEDLLGRGCPHDLALQILTGTMWSGDDPKWNYTDHQLKQNYEQSPS